MDPNGQLAQEGPLRAQGFYVSGFIFDAYRSVPPARAYLEPKNDLGLLNLDWITHRFGVFSKVGKQVP